jgi:hypothetical protein
MDSMYRLRVDLGIIGWGGFWWIVTQQSIYLRKIVMIIKQRVEQAPDIIAVFDVCCVIVQVWQNEVRWLANSE